MLKTETQDSKIRLTGKHNNMIEKVTQFFEYLVTEYCNIFLGTAESNTILSLPQIFWFDHILEAFIFLHFYVDFFNLFQTAYIGEKIKPVKQKHFLS